MLYALLECPPRQCQPGLGGVAVTPCIRVKLPADLELLVRRQRQQGCPADQTTFLAKLDRPAAGRGDHARVLGDPLLQDQAHGGGVVNPVHRRSQPPRDLGIAVGAHRCPGIVGAPRPEGKPLGEQSLGHEHTIAAT